MITSDELITAIKERADEKFKENFKMLINALEHFKDDRKRLAELTYSFAITDPVGFLKAFTGADDDDLEYVKTNRIPEIREAHGTSVKLTVRKLIPTPILEEYMKMTNNIILDTKRTRAEITGGGVVTVIAFFIPEDADFSLAVRDIGIFMSLIFNSVQEMEVGA